MNFAQQVLDLFEPITHKPMDAGKKVFNRVSKFLHPDAQPVPSCFTAVTECVAVQVPGLCPAFQRNALKRRAARTSTVGATGKRFRPRLPLLTVEALQRLSCVDLGSLFLAFA